MSKFSKKWLSEAFDDGLDDSEFDENPTEKAVKFAQTCEFFEVKPGKRPGEFVIWQTGYGSSNDPEHQLLLLCREANVDKRKISYELKSRCFCLYTDYWHPCDEDREYMDKLEREDRERENDWLNHPEIGELADYDENDNPRIYPESVSPKFETRLGKIWECLSTGMFGNSQPTAGVFSGDNFASGDTRIPVPLGGYTRMGKAGKKRKFRKVSK